jgi:hypothetical protein
MEWASGSVPIHSNLGNESSLPAGQSIDIPAVLHRKADTSPGLSHFPALWLSFGWFSAEVPGRWFMPWVCMGVGGGDTEE